MKTTKTELRKAVDAFLYTFNDLTGGTSKENHSRASLGLNALQRQAFAISIMAVNPSKTCAADTHLMDYAKEHIPRKIDLYLEAYPHAANPTS